MLKLKKYSEKCSKKYSKKCLSNLQLLPRTRRGRKNLWWDICIIVLIVVAIVDAINIIICFIIGTRILISVKFDCTIFLQVGPRLILDDFTDSLYASKSTIAFGVSTNKNAIN